MGNFVSSRTPEGQPGRCPLCQATVCIEPSALTGDAPCPRCGQLLWFALVPPNVYFYPSDEVVPAKRRKVEAVLRRIYEDLGVSLEGFPSPDLFSQEVGVDSLDIVELMMELEEEFEITIPDDQAEKMRSLADVIDYLVRKSPD